MRILLIQLSDMHLTSVDDQAASRLLAIRSAVMMNPITYDACFIVLSGDITSTGTAHEFEAAALYLQDLRASLMTTGIPVVEFVAVPGNHDCDLTRQDDTRLYLLESLSTYFEKPIDYLGANFRSLTAVQDPFIAFEAEICKQEVRSGQRKLYDRRVFTVGGKTVSFHCFNTAWLSRRHELQSELFIPSEILLPPSKDTSLSVAVFHHPYNWLNSNNYRVFQGFVETFCNLALCGHEHSQRLERVTVPLLGPTDYFHAPAFHDPSVAQNGFASVDLDFAAEQQLTTVFAWRGDRFTVSSQNSQSLHKAQESTVDPFETTLQFQRELNEVGTGFQHPRCIPPQCELRLSDLYVYPDLKHQTLDRILGNQSGGTGNILGDGIVDFITEKKYALIYGAESSGKSALAKTICQDLRARQYLPILLNGEELRGRKREGQLRDLFSRLVAAQYGEASVELFQQFEKDRKFLIIDDLDKSRFSREDQVTMVETLLPYVSRCVIFASDYLQIQEMAVQQQADPFRLFERCTIKEFGRFHRFRLIEKWIFFGRDQTEDSQELEKLVLRLDKTLATLLGRNVVPHHPITILHLLVLLESGEVSNTANGAYGYMYEVLIKGALSRVNAQDVEVKTTYISRIGYAMFQARQKSLTNEELATVHQSYLDYYDMEKSFERMKSDLLQARILNESPAGVFRFKYPYILYYSIAKYMSDHRDQLQDELRKLADHLYSDMNANVLIFYVYLTKDIPLITYMVEQARLIYQEEKACNMEGSVAFLNTIYSAQPPPLELPGGEARDNRQEHNRKQDEADENEVASTVETSSEIEVAYNPDLNEFVKLGISFKTLNILGQILRNFTGSLDGQIKLELTRECYAVGMRTLQRLLSITSDLVMMRQYIGGLIAERTGVSDKQELATRTDLAIVWVSIMSGFGFVKRVAYAVGHSDLTKTYKKVLDEDNSLSTEIIDVAIKLDHSERIPEKELKALKSRVEDNRYAEMIVRDLVADFLYLYSVDYPTVQALGSMWNIKITPVKFLSNRSKKT